MRSCLSNHSESRGSTFTCTSILLNEVVSPSEIMFHVQSFCQVQFNAVTGNVDISVRSKITAGQGRTNFMSRKKLK